MLDKALQLSTAQAEVAAEIGRATTTGFVVMLEASHAFAAATSENQMAFLSALLAVQTPEAAAHLQKAYLSRALHAASEMATRMAAAFAGAARPLGPAPARPSP